MDKSLKAYLKIEALLFMREPLQIIFSFIFPQMIFMIFASMYGNNQFGNVEYFELYIPGYFTIITFIISMFMVGYQMVIDKENGVYKRLKATPFTLGTIYQAMIYKTVVLCTVGGIEIILIAKFVYGAKLSSHWGQFLLAFFMGNMLAVAAGFIIFSLCRTSKQAVTVIIILFYPCVMLGDSTFPLSMMPQFVQKMAPVINPLYHLNRVMRGGWNGSILEEMKSMVYVIVVILLLGVVVYRYDRTVDNF